MAFSIQQLTDDSKFSQALRFEVLEQLCPRERVRDLLTRCHDWGKRERSLNQLLIVYYIIALALFRRLASFGSAGPAGARAALAVAEPLSGPANGGGVGVSSSATGQPDHAPSVPTRLPSHGHGSDQRGFSLRMAAHGHRWHLG
jgi:hypothetical protein